MTKIKIVLPDQTEIICSFSYERVPIDDAIIKVLGKAWPTRYNEEVLVKTTHHWSISLGNDALATFKELFQAKKIEFVPLLHSNSEGHIDFDNLYVVIDTIGNTTIPKLLMGIAIFTICTRLLAKHDIKMDVFLNTINRLVIACVTKEGYWDVDRLNDLWIILNGYFTNNLECYFKEFED